METKKDPYEFAARLKRIMAILGLSQSDLAKATGLTPGAVSQLMNGLREPSLHTIVKILRVIPVKFEGLVKVK